MSRTILHLSVSSLPSEAEPIVASQRQDPAVSVETISFADASPEEILARVFAADSVCVWSPRLVAE